VGFSLWEGKKVMGFLRRPYEPILGNAEKTALTERTLFSFLLKQKSENLRYVLAHLKAERGDFEARISLFTGTIAKVGIFPALLAYFSLLQKLNLLDNSAIGLLVQVVAYATPAFYFFAFPFNVVSARMDRHISLIELAANQVESGAAKRIHRR
jgi:hypothetical protein